MASTVHKSSWLSEDSYKIAHTIGACNEQLMSPANSLMTKGTLKKRTYFTRDNWRERVSPAFAAYWSTRKALELFAGSTEEGFKERFAGLWKKSQDAEQVLSQEIAQIPDAVSPRIWNAITAELDGLEAVPRSTEEGMVYAINPESSILFRYITFLKFGITYRSLITALDLDGDAEADDKLRKVHIDLSRLKSGELSFKDLKLKFSLVHFILIVQGLELGLENLNQIELSKCLDEICPCKQKHSVDGMKKFRTSVKKVIRDLLSDKSKTYKPFLF